MKDISNGIVDQSAAPRIPMKPLLRLPALLPIAPAEKPLPMTEVPLNLAITTRQAALILGVSIEAMKKWRQRTGSGPLFMRYRDGAIRYRLSTIMQFMTDCTVEP